MTEDRAFRATSTVLLVILVAGTVSLLAGVSFEWLRRQNEETQALVGQVSEELQQAQAERDRAGRIAFRLLRLELRRVRLSERVQLCTIVALQGGRLPRCAGVRQDAASLARVIQDFRERLRASGGGGGGGGTSSGPTRTTTATRTITTAPPQGCPKPNPNNPNC